MYVFELASPHHDTRTPLVCVCVFLPACFWHLCLRPQHRGRLLTSPEVTPRPGVTHASPAPTCPCSCPEPPPPLARQKVPGILSRGLDRLGSGHQVWPVWLVVTSDSPTRLVAAPPVLCANLGRDNFCSEVSKPPPLWRFCLINLWSSSLSHPQARPAAREFTSWQGETEVKTGP